MTSGLFIKTEKFRVLVLAAIAVAVMVPVLLFGLPNGHDLPHHYQCAMTFAESIRDGDLYPSWSLNRNFGFGGMETRLYPPLSHYTLALAHLATGEWHLASFIVFVLFAFAGSFGAYLWASESMPREHALFAGCLYALIPYHLNQLYNTFFYAEYAGSAVLPFVFLFVSRVCRRGSAGDIAGLAASFALLILTHLPLTVIGSVCFAAYALTRLDRERFTGQIAKLAGGVAIALAASSFFWTKVLFEKDLMAKAAVYADPWLDYRLNFLLTAIQTYEGIGLEVYQNGTSFYDLTLFYALLVGLACTIPFFIANRKFDAADKGVWLVLAVALFMTLPFSSFIWSRVGFLQEVQFPWRWLAIVSIAAPVVAASKMGELADWFKSKKRPLALLVCGCVFATLTFSIAQIIRPAPFITKSRIESYMTENAKEIGFTFWWPRTVRKSFADDKSAVSADGRAASVDKLSAVDRTFSIAEGTPTNARIGVFYHPNWRAAVNGRNAAVMPGPDGAVMIPIPSEASTISLSFIEPTPTAAARWISLGGWFAVFLMLTLKPFSTFRRKSTLAV